MVDGIYTSHPCGSGQNWFQCDTRYSKLRQAEKSRQLMPKLRSAILCERTAATLSELAGASVAKNIPKKYFRVTIVRCHGPKFGNH